MSCQSWLSGHQLFIINFIKFKFQPVLLCQLQKLIPICNNELNFYPVYAIKAYMYWTECLTMFTHKLTAYWNLRVSCQSIDFHGQCVCCDNMAGNAFSGPILGLHPANERQCYDISHWLSASLGWAQILLEQRLSGFSTEATSRNTNAVIGIIHHHICTDIDNQIKCIIIEKLTHA